MSLDRNLSFGRDRVQTDFDLGGYIRRLPARLRWRRRRTDPVHLHRRPGPGLSDALGPRSVAHNSPFDHDGRSYRSTAKVVANLFGVDSCSAASDADHRCVITFDAGDFLDQ